MKLKKTLKLALNKQKELKKLKLNFFDVYKLITAPESQMTTKLFKNDLLINSPFWYLHGLKELFIEETYKFNTTKSNPRIIDCGANIGLSLIYFKRLYPNAVITAFEPDKDIFAILKTNLSNFSYGDIELINKAVWNSNNSIKFLASGGVGGRINKAEEGEQVIEIPAVRLKDYLEKEIDFLKIDIEGAEFDVINDCKEKLNNVHNIFIEYHSEENREQKLDEILKILKDAKFKYYIKEAWNNQPMPYVNNRTNLFDLQLNIFGYRI